MCSPCCSVERKWSVRSRCAPVHRRRSTAPHRNPSAPSPADVRLIGVMGLAVMLSQLKGELAELEKAILAGAAICADSVLSKHAPWVEELKTQYFPPWMQITSLNWAQAANPLPAPFLFSTPFYKIRYQIMADFAERCLFSCEKTPQYCINSSLTCDFSPLYKNTAAFLVRIRGPPSEI